MAWAAKRQEPETLGDPFLLLSTLLVHKYPEDAVHNKQKTFKL